MGKKKLRAAEKKLMSDAKVAVEETRKRAETESRDAVEAVERRLLKETEAKVEKAKARLQEARDRLADLKGEPRGNPRDDLSAVDNEEIGEDDVSYEYSDEPAGSQAGSVHPAVE